MVKRGKLYFNSWLQVMVEYGMHGYQCDQYFVKCLEVGSVGEARGDHSAAATTTTTR